MSGSASTQCNCALASRNPHVGLVFTKTAHLLHPSLILVALCFVSPCIANAAGVRHGDVPCLTGSQPDNLKKYMALLHPYTSDPDRVGEFAVFHIDRNPEKSGFSSDVRTDGLAPCLRSQHARVYVVSLGERIPTVSRMLHPVEAMLLQGLNPAFVPQRMSRQRVFEGVGNAMTVPVIGSILLEVLRLCSDSLGDSASVSGSSDSDSEASISSSSS